ncbi:MAG: 2-C-methyl-D-erythritol 4-phosphate cytidylyltransferase, partial [Gaiellales bacterium]
SHVDEVWGVLVGAGRGERFGAGRPKAFASLGGRPMLAESLERLEAADAVDGLIAVVPEGWEEPSILCAEEVGVGKLSATVPGGQTRVASVSSGVAEVPDTATVIFVHDAARPLVDAAVIERVLAGLEGGFDGSVPALRITDTVKRVIGDAVVETLDRSGLVTAQTPQAFRADVFRRALAGPSDAATDCASLVEQAGGRVRIVDGDPRLLKVTTRPDLDRVEQLLRKG